MSAWPSAKKLGTFLPTSIYQGVQSQQDGLPGREGYYCPHTEQPIDGNKPAYTLQEG